MYIFTTMAMLKGKSVEVASSIQRNLTDIRRLRKILKTVYFISNHLGSVMVRQKQPCIIIAWIEA